jgi:hypothetical protein
MIATNGVALVKPVTSHSPFDEWHINCAIRYILAFRSRKMFGDNFYGFGLVT